MAGRKKIYLDLRYWILLRDTTEKTADNSALSNLYEILKKGVESGKIICPLSDSIFLEILKQNDPKTRLRSAKLVDDLSLGVTIENQFCRMKYEIADMYTKFGVHKTSITPSHQLIWTKAPYVLGETHPSETAFDTKTELVIQKAFFDFMWAISFTEMMKRLDGAEIPNLDRRRTGRMLDDGKRTHAEELKSFRQAYVAEARGMADFAAQFGVEVIKDAASLAEVSTERGSRKQDEETLRFCRNLIAHVLEKNKARTDLKTLHILSCLHASHRWNRSQRFDGNDLYDFDHATAAVGYCDVFLTEKPLQTMLAQKHTNLRKDFHCAVFSDVAAATAHIDLIV